MSNIYSFRSEEQREEEASLWVARLDRGLSEAEADALRDWVRETPRNKALLLEMAELWDRMDSLSVLSELFDPPVQHRHRAPALGRTVWAVAASVLALVFAVHLLVPSLPWQDPADEPRLSEADDPANTVYETGVGANSTVNLPDGTRLRLNTDTRVSVAYSAEQRRLQLERGELHVEVAHEPDRPLRVLAGERVVEAVGTAFNVYMKGDRHFDVIVTEGRVRVQLAELGLDEDADSGRSQPEAVRELTRGQRYRVEGGETAEPEALAESEIDDRLSWRDGNLVFRGETLREALEEVSRYTPEHFEVLDSEIYDLRLAGLYKAGDVEALLSALRENFSIKHERHADGRIELSLQDGAASEG